MDFLNNLEIDVIDKDIKNNLSKQEQFEIMKLKNNENIVVQKANTGGAVKIKTKDTTNK